MTHLLHLPTLLRLARETLSDPREGARHIMGLNLPRRILMQFYLLELVLSAMSSVIFLSMAPLPDGMSMPAETAVTYTAFEGMVGLILAFGAFRIGAAFGGRGSFEQAFALVIWAQFILLCFSVIQLAALFVLPPLTDVISIAALALFFWLMVNFVAELHGFTSLGLVFAGIIVSLLGLAILLSILFSAMGLSLV
ncbi:Yip1 family protein [Nioella aestuarii]|uniref:Yip1 family protein n=1 Tax=Nioella aestuarii TaxID=1662864 RepID=UPI003D7FE29A